jgi:tRNA-specific 2-thiouridylase
LQFQVRNIAQKYFADLSVTTKKESMGICFIGKRDFNEFLGNYFQLTRGNFVDYDTKEIVGSHMGKEAFTSNSYQIYKGKKI